MTFHTEGIILHRRAWHETGRMYVIYTRESGKVLAVGRGTRKVLSKLAAHLEPYSRVDLFLAQGKRHATIAGAKMTRASESCVANDARYVSAAFVAESFDQLVKWGDRDERLWNLLDGFYGEIGRAEPVEIAGLVAEYLWRFMDALGYGPRLNECATCEKSPLTADAWFVPASGTVSCRACRSEERSFATAEPVSARDIAEVVEFLRGNGGRVHAESGTAIRLAHLFLEAHLDRPLMTQALLREIVPLPKTPALSTIP